MEVTGLPELSAQVPWLPQLAVEEGRGGSRPFDKRTHGYCQWHLLITHEPSRTAILRAPQHVIVQALFPYLMK